MKTVPIGCMPFSRVMLEALGVEPSVELVGIVSRRPGRCNADFETLVSSG